MEYIKECKIIVFILWLELVFIKCIYIRRIVEEIHNNLWRFFCVQIKSIVNWIQIENAILFYVLSISYLLCVNCFSPHFSQFCLHHPKQNILGGKNNICRMFFHFDIQTKVYFNMNPLFHCNVIIKPTLFSNPYRKWIFSHLNETSNTFEGMIL